MDHKREDRTPPLARVMGVGRHNNSNNRYMRMCAKLKDPVFLVQLHFLQNLEPLFIPFLSTLLQREVPLIHELHYQLSELVRIIMMRFLKQSVVSDKSGISLLSVDIDNTDNRLKHDQEIEIGEPTSKALKKSRYEQ